MKATITSTDRIVEIDAVGVECDSQYGSGGLCRTKARVWEGVTEGGVAFVAYIPLVMVHAADDNSEFERELAEHKSPEPDTLRAIDARHETKNNTSKLVCFLEADIDGDAIGFERDETNPNAVTMTVPGSMSAAVVTIDLATLFPKKAAQ